MDYGTGFVCAFGIITVFCSLVVIILLTMAMSAVIRRFEKPAPAASPASAAPAKDPAVAVSPASAAPPAVPAASEPLDPQLVAAITAVIAEDLGVTFRDVTLTAIRKV